MKEIERMCFTTLKYLLMEPLTFEKLLFKANSEGNNMTEILIRSIRCAYEEGLIIIEGFNEDSISEMWENEYKGRISLSVRAIWIVDKFLRKKHINALDIQLASELGKYREI